MRKFSCYKIIAVYMGTVVGAGFASGQEILQFFVMHGTPGLLGITAAGIMFAWFGTVILYLALKCRAVNYREVLTALMGKNLVVLFDILSFFILLGGASVMLAGSGAVFKEQLGLPPSVGIFLIILITLPVIMSGLAGIIMANAIIVPLKIFAIFFVILAAVVLNGGLQFPSQSLFLPEKIMGNWLFAAVLYVSYNMVIPMAALSSLGKYVEKNTAIKAGILGGLGLGLVAFVVAIGELTFCPEITNYQVPLLYIAGLINPVLRVIISLVIWMAILTTLIGNVHGIASRLAPRGGNRYKIAGTIAMFLSLPLTLYDFSTLVSTLCPLFGYGGLVLLLSLAIFPFKRFFN